MLFRLPLVLLLLAAPLARADALPPSLAPLGEGMVAEVLSGDQMALADGRTLRLAGVEAPRPGEPLAEDARAALAALARGRTVALHRAGQERDRHGRLLAQVGLDGRWLQADLLRQGWVRVRSFPESRAATADLLAAEAEARAAGRGLWGHPAHAVRTPSDVEPGAVRLVRGTVRRADKEEGAMVLRFGREPTRGFAVHLPTRDLRAYRKAGLDPQALVGRTVEVRGWVEAGERGAVMRLSHPEQLQAVP